MTKKEKQAYETPDALKEILHKALDKKKFRLECGHHITFTEVLGNDLTIRNGKDFVVICAMCGY